ncbi:MAG: hypothetical protein U5J63_13660 [Fodinibius sp.]|nr:hypothetical protein [Fodinibius sp.]
MHWTTRPIGWGVKWAERKLPQLLQGERAPYGVYPLFELGGDVGIAYGLLLYHNQFLNTITRYESRLFLDLRSTTTSTLNIRSPLSSHQPVSLISTRATPTIRLNHYTAVTART